jgi:acetyltransferase-like isoleucine patch superfamily enzyme
VSRAYNGVVSDERREATDPGPDRKSFAKDQSKNPPPKNTLDRVLRYFARPAYFVCVLLLYALVSTALGLALAPALWCFDHLARWSASLPGPLHWVALGTSAALCFFVAGLALLVVVPVYNWILPTRIHAFKGGYYSIYTIPWFLHNGLFYLVRYTFLPFVTLTPFGIWFLKAMGMTIGRHAFVNTEYISDPRLITLGDDAALGGSVRIFAHYGGGGSFVVAPVVIGRRATIGLGATVMGDVEVGEGATVLPHSVLLPGSRVGAGETWGGVPAQRIPREEMDRFKEGIRGTRTVELP